jgi:hypothetical protein
MQALLAPMPHMRAVLAANTSDVPDGMFGTARAHAIVQRSIRHLPPLLSTIIPRHSYSLPTLNTDA